MANTYTRLQMIAFMRWARKRSTANNLLRDDKKLFEEYENEEVPKQNKRLFNFLFNSKK